MRVAFIGGAPRSGTTLLGSILGSHPSVVATPESAFKTDVFRDLQKSPAELDSQAFAAYLRGHRDFKTWDALLDLGGFGHGVGQSAVAAVVERAVMCYARSVDKGAAEVWVDHTPHNPKFAVTLNELFPGCKMVLVVRDGRAVANSSVPLRWGPNTVFHAAAVWGIHTAYALAAEEALGSARTHRIRFEDLVSDPHGVLPELCNFLGLDFDPVMLEGKDYVVPMAHRKLHPLVGQAPSAARADAWQHSLLARDIEIFEAATGELLSMLGYENQYGALARPANRRERLRFLAVEAAFQHVVNPYRVWRQKRHIRLADRESQLSTKTVIDEAAGSPT